MSQALAQITLVPEAKDTDLKNETKIKEMFVKAMNQLKGIWEHTKYAEEFVHCETKLPEEKESPLDDYEVVKEVLKNGDKHPKFAEYKKEFKFLFRHCIRRDYFLHFRKCDRLECCKEVPKCPEAIDILDKLDQHRTLLCPVLDQNWLEGKHYVSFLDIKDNKEILEAIQKKMLRDRVN